MNIITFGTFDMFHIGHLNILERAKAQGVKLTVGVSSDALNFSKKQRNPICDERDRMRIVAALSCVDEVFLEKSLELKADYITHFKADCLVMWDDWEGRFDHLSHLCKVIYLSRTPAISTTQLIEVVKEIR
ncbi:glycerol-3-phosphate cytidylyltransferase [Shewanella sp. 10N.286.51.B7]|uniref:Adenylyltransferase/cytidyltransferase family protein n=1 Tax=Shewanella electrodiphila TaxID=934143 RepID=A0ABT0KUK9_9GAMM|nr:MULTISPECIES: adenylyltransferase/cytidyltransferase family protein [Shewanella]MCL1047364.1 adenylyltransferase/cytidyltransferase family protein [Shewanella electrodiphila]PMG78671.1 glycerol-3-phosphate cytidylyltransferase [Shewanella sp. 10N.286.51.B7]